MDAPLSTRMELLTKFTANSTKAFKFSPGCEVGFPEVQNHIKQVQPSVYTVTKLVEREEGL